MLRRVRPLAVALATIPLLGACGGGTANDDSLPPLTPEPGLSLPSTDETAPSEPSGSSGPASRESYPARLALARFLRGAGAGDVRVCGYLSPSYARTAFATTGGCAQWIKSTAGRLTAEQQDALKTVKVLGATPGPRAGQYTVQPDDLSWRAGTAVPSGVVAKRYVLARSGARWLVVA